MELGLRETLQWGVRATATSSGDDAAQTQDACRGSNRCISNSCNSNSSSRSSTSRSRNSKKMTLEARQEARPTGASAVPLRLYSAAESDSYCSDLRVHPRAEAAAAAGDCCGWVESTAEGPYGVMPCDEACFSAGDSTDTLLDVDPFEAPPPIHKTAAAATTAATAAAADSWQMPLLMVSSPSSSANGEAIGGSPAAFECLYHYHQQQQQHWVYRSVPLLVGCVRNLVLSPLRMSLNLLLLLPKCLLPGPQPAFSLRRFLLFLGPGWLVAMAYVDPGNLEADLQAGGARKELPFRGDEGGDTMRQAEGDSYAMLSLLLWGHAVGWVFQVLASRLGNVTSTDLATNEYSRAASFFLWLATELAIIGADFQAVIGSALAIQLLLGLPIWVGVCLTLADCFSVLLFKGSGSRWLESLFGCFILVMALCFGLNLCLSRPSLPLLLRGLLLPYVPTSRTKAAQLLSMLGCIIMPHGLYLHSALVRSRAVQREKPDKVAEANFYFGLEAAVALTVSFLLNASVLCTFANPLVFSPEGLNLTTAPEALRRAFGFTAFFAWALGLLAAGQNATMAGTYAGQFTMQGFLRLRCGRATRLMVTRLITIVPLLLLLLLRKEVLDRVSEGINILQALLLPVALVPLLVFNASSKVMGPFVLKGWRRFAATILAAGLAATNCIMVLLELFSAALSGMQQLLLLLALCGYTAILVATALRPVRGVYCRCLLSEAERLQQGSPTQRPPGDNLHVSTYRQRETAAAEKAAAAPAANLNERFD